MAQYNCTNIAIVRWYNGAWSSTQKDGFQCGPNGSYGQNGGIIKFTTGSKVLKNYTITINGTIVKKNSYTPTIYVYLYSSDPGSSHTPSGTGSLGGLTSLASGTQKYSGASSEQAKDITITLTGSEQLNANTTYYLWVTSSTFVNNFDYTNDSTAITVSGDEPTIKICYDFYNVNNVQIDSDTYQLDSEYNRVQTKGTASEQPGTTIAELTAQGTHKVKWPSEFGVFRPGYTFDRYVFTVDETTWTCKPGSSYTGTTFGIEYGDRVYLTGKYWNPNIYKITFNKKSGSGGSSEVYLKYDTGWYSESTATTSTTSITPPTRTNYDFGGYYTKENGEETQIIDSDGNIIAGNTAFSADTTLYAHWIAATKYTIKFDGNGYDGGDLPENINATGASASETVMGDIGKNVPTKTGAVFRGWSAASTYNNNRIAYYDHDPTYGGGPDSKDVSPTQTASYWTFKDYLDKTGSTSTGTTLTLYAQWEYPITFYPNTGDTVSNMPDNGYKQHNISYKLPSNSPTRSGYSFKGWSENNLSTTASYQPNGSISTNAAKTLYAVWEQNTNTYTITFDGNGNTGGSLPETKTANGASASEATMGDIDGNVPTKTGAIFRGWSSTSTYNQKRIAYYDDKPAYGGGPDSEGNSPTETSSSWTFAKYCECTDSTTTGTTLTLYAQWEYPITFYPNTTDTVSNMPAKGYKQHGINYYIPNVIPTRTGYTFKGWSTNSAATAPMPAFAAGRSYSGNVARDLYAVWEVNQYTVITTAQTGIASISGGGTYSSGATVTLTATPQYGYSFTCWLDEENNIYNSNPLTITNLTKHKSFQAFGDLLNYSITYNANGGSGTMVPGEKIHGQSFTLPSSNFTPPTTKKNTFSIKCYHNDGSSNYNSNIGSKITAYSFNQWRLNSSTGTTYAVGETYTADNNATFYAEWKSTISYSAVTLPTLTSRENETTYGYTVNYDPNEGEEMALQSQTAIDTISYTFEGWGTSSSDTSVNYNGGQSYPFTSATNLYAIWSSNTSRGGFNLPTQDDVQRAGYTLLGWSKTKTASYATYDPGDFYTPTSNNETLYAIWSQNLFTITLNHQGGTASISSIKWQYNTQKWFNSSGSQINYITPPTKTGYIFNGYYQGTTTQIIDSSGNFVASNTWTTQSCVIIAKWTPITYTINFKNGIYTEILDSTKLTQNFTYNQAQKLYSGQFKRQHTIQYVLDGGTGQNSSTTLFDFNGWQDEKGTTYSNEQSVKNLTTTNGATLNFYPQWSVEKINLPTPTKTGHVFVGWYDANNNKIGDGGSEYEITTNTTLYAKWKAKTLTVRFYRNSPDGSATAQYTQIYTYGDTHKQFGYDTNGNKLNVQTANSYADLYGYRAWSFPGYKIIGWNTDSTSTTATYDTYYTITDDFINRRISSTGTGSGSLTLYAIWDYNGLVRIYYNNEWRMAIPYIYNGTNWKQALPYVYDKKDESEDEYAWKLGV